MDKLIAEVVRVDTVPTVVESRNPQGRAGELWEQFKRLKPGEALKVTCRSVAHAGSTKRELLRKATKVGVVVMSRRDGNDYYCWRGER